MCLKERSKISFPENNDRKRTLKSVPALGFQIHGLHGLSINKKIQIYPGDKLVFQSTGSTIVKVLMKLAIFTNFTHGSDDNPTLSRSPLKFFKNSDDSCFLMPQAKIVIKLLVWLG